MKPFHISDIINIELYCFSGKIANSFSEGQSIPRVWRTWGEDHVRYINILTWFRGFQDKPSILSVFFLFVSKSLLRIERQI